MHDPAANPPQPSDADEALDQLPPALVASLRELNASAPQTPVRLNTLDAAIFAAADEHFAAAAPIASHTDLRIPNPDSRPSASPVLAAIGPRRGYRIAAGLLALAAAIALAVILPGVFSNVPSDTGDQERTRRSTDPRINPPAAFAEADLNRDGQVNLLDAYLLQRRIEMQARLESAWDLTRDGVVDQRDVQAIATKSVKLPPSGASAAPTNAEHVPTGGASSLAPAERGRL